MRTRAENRHRGGEEWGEAGDGRGEMKGKRQVLMQRQGDRETGGDRWG